MSDLDTLMRELVIANRILAREGVVDTFGHVSIRHPERPDHYFMSRSRAPELVTVEDLMEFELDGTPVDARGRTPYGERFIHSAMFEARPEVRSVIHNHSQTVIPFSVTNVPLRPLSHIAAPMGNDAPVWDIRDKFGDTDLLVVNMEQGRDLARVVGKGSVALMRGHGCVVAGASVREAVFTAVYLQVNARLQLDALRLGEPRYLSPGEVERATKRQFSPLALDRAWEHWRLRAGADEL
jgi:HCOMODA/2-hydroxy-3-carboxy-muconic semialdehyde decarboxylase